MKIIDILNKKANRTLEDGFKFKYNCRTYIYNKEEDNIVNINIRKQIGESYILERCLNNTVEVIEENKEIEELKFEEGTYVGEKVNQIADKLNELVRAVNKLTKKER